MTKKDFELIAGMLGRGLKPRAITTDLIWEVNRALQSDNPAFDPVRFWKAVSAARAVKE